MSVDAKLERAKLDATSNERRDAQGDGGCARDARRSSTSPAAPASQNHCLPGPRRKLPRRGDDTRTRLGRDERTRLHLPPRRGDLARRQVRRHRHGHQRPLQSLLCRARDRYRAGLPGRRLYPLPRQHRGKPGPPEAGDPFDARAWRRRARARARDGRVGERAEAPSCGIARGPGDAPPPGLKASFVAPENKEGARKAAAHLISSGHRRIAFVGGVSSMLVREERLAATDSPWKRRKFRSTCRWSWKR